jgi:hypothetical protein
MVRPSFSSGFSSGLQQIPDFRVAFGADPNLASFWANGTKNLQV